jgi:dihydrofolate reductase
MVASLRDEALGSLVFTGSNDPSTGGAAFLLGRRTYEDFHRVWPHRTDNPFTEILNERQKFVASTTLSEPLPWTNSTLLSGAVPDAVRELKESGDGTLTILGSGQLVKSLMVHGLIDRYLLAVHPLVLGTGHRLFPDAEVALELVDTASTPAGVLVATYRPAPPAASRGT